MAVGLNLPPPATAIDILLHLTPYPTVTVPAPAPPGPRGNYTLYPNTRLQGDFRMGSDPTVPACEAACSAAQGCECFAYCASPATPGCPRGPSCWFYTGNLTPTPGAGFTAGCRHDPPGPPTGNESLWVAYDGATPRGSDTFAFYPLYPSEALGGLQPLGSGDRRTGQASVAAYVPDFASTPRPLDVFVAAALALAGSGAAPPAPAAFSPAAIVAGLEAWLGRALGRNQLGRAPGGGVENAGVARGVTELLLGSGLLAPAVTPAGAAAGAQWYARLFPVWPAASRGGAAFSGLGAKGGCVYGAALAAAGGGVAGAVRVGLVEGLSSGACALLCPWPGQEARVGALCEGGAQPLTWVNVSEGAVLSVRLGGAWGAQCNVSLSA